MHHPPTVRPIRGSVTGPFFLKFGHTLAPVHFKSRNTWGRNSALSEMAILHTFPDEPRG